MKQLNRNDLFCWSHFDEERNIDFNSFLWKRADGNILFDPLPLSKHDEKHLEDLGGAKWIIVSNSDHIRDAKSIASKTGAKIAGPAQEKNEFPLTCEQWLEQGAEFLSGLEIFEMDGSKPPENSHLYWTRVS